jgi:hypothetical protein
MQRRIARTILWLALLSAASQHELLIGLVVIPAVVVSAIGFVLTWVGAAFGAWLLWYHRRHGRLPRWLTYERLAGWVARLPWRVGRTPRQMRRAARRQQPSQQGGAEAPDLAPALALAICATACSSPAGGPEGEPAWSHLA